MSADDQAFLDVLSSVPNDIWRYSNAIADYVDQHLAKVSNTLREALSSSQWIPESARPRPPRPPPQSFAQAVASSTTFIAQVHQWIFKNKILTTVIVIALGGVTYHVVKRKSSYRKKRRAKRANNGARLEVVVVAGSPSEAITRSVMLDLERRGFIVYVVCNTIEEELLVQNESRPDIKPLTIDIVDPSSARASIDRFTAHLQTPHAAFQGAKAHHLTLRSLILIPSSTYPSLPIAALSASNLSDLLNTRLLTPILTLQNFLPLLQRLPFSHPHLHANSAGPVPRPSVLLLTPSIITSLSPAFHAPESLINSALTSLSRVLTAEISPLNIPVTHLQLGTFDTSTFTPHSRNTTTPSAQRAETLRWDNSTRLSYSKNFVASTSTEGSKSALGKGTPLRELNNAVFDAIVRGRGGIVRVGMGSGLYGFVGRWVPSGLVSWMMGVRRVEGGVMQGEFGRGLITAGPASSVGSESERGPESPASRFPISRLGTGDSEYISVSGDRDNDKEHGVDGEGL
ncbi:hypothetical protein WAI453_011363 [Rhynchosporium graminicola]|uniref:DUF1776-domain-containing protein n=1 Tax=Rhynchosporium graminicola TaxID=2792576 RepID=A0A1E1KBI7_9HELO|nr:uncharacterized protein RCO7_05729 [Rhynchosporium commune]